MSKPRSSRRPEWEGGAAPPLDRCVQVMRQAHGRDLSLFETTFLAQALQRRLTQTASTSWPAYLQRLAQDPAEGAAFWQSLSIAHSEFFRNPLTFALLEQLILPSLVATKGATDPTELRIWSAGCAAGQEAWSVAILLAELAAARDGPVPCRIFATDVSEPALALARRGDYDRAALQNVPLKHLQRYFVGQGEAYALIPALKSWVAFSTYDLLEERTACPPASLYGDFDLIFCCNLLFYYRTDVRQRILDKVWKALAPGGYLVTGEVERDFVAKHEGLRAVAPPAALFQKQR